MNIERLGEARDMAPWEVLQTAPFARAQANTDPAELSFLPSSQVLCVSNTVVRPCGRDLAASLWSCWKQLCLVSVGVQKSI